MSHSFTQFHTVSHRVTQCRQTMSKHMLHRIHRGTDTQEVEVEQKEDILQTEAERTGVMVDIDKIWEKRNYKETVQEGEMMEVAEMGAIKVIEEGMH